MGAIKVRLMTNNGGKVLIDLCDTEEQLQKMTVLHLKEKIAPKFPEVFDENAYLIFCNKRLGGDSTLLSECGIQHMAIIYTMVKLAAGAGSLQRRH